jgi:hypothetical protein
MSCPTDLWDCVSYIPIVGGYFDIGKSAADSAAGSAWYAICQSFGDAATGMLQAFAKAFAAIPPVDLASGGVKSVYGLSMGIGAVVAALLLLGQVIRTAFTHDGSPLATAAAGAGKTVLAFLLTLSVGTAALTASDALTHVIITTTFGSDAELTTRLGGLLTGTTAGSGGLMTAAILLIFGIIGILLVIILWFEMLLRNAAIAILVATSPIAAAGQMSESTKGWWTKLVAAAMQLIILKPVIALTFAIGLSLTGQSQSIETLLAGMLVLLLATFAWPVVARFFTFTSVTVAGGAGLAALVGFAAGRVSGGGPGPAGINPADFSRHAEARTMAGREAAAAASPATAATAGPARAGAAAGTGIGGPLAAGAGFALRAAQQSLNTLAGRMEQTAGHAGMAGANPYAQPAGYQGQRSYPSGRGRPRAAGEREMAPRQDGDARQAPPPTAADPAPQVPAAGDPMIRETPGRDGEQP